MRTRMDRRLESRSLAAEESSNAVCHDHRSLPVPSLCDDARRDGIESAVTRESQFNLTSKYDIYYIRMG